MTSFRVLVANRGEIAVRVIKACQALGFQSVLAVSDIDRDSLGARMADAVVCIGPAPAEKSYLSRESVVASALGTDCRAIHPGYGFLAEDAKFAGMCAEAGLIFVGPSPTILRLFGDKVTSRRVAEEIGAVPVAPASGVLRSLHAAIANARRLDYPIVLKAVAGGGGRGMRIVRDQHELKTAFGPATAEAKAAFRDERLYAERLIPNARHVEVQIIGDGQGCVIHLGDRDCSLQRRGQKLLEEAPAPVLPADLQQRLRSAAARLAAAVGFDSVGTVEFIVDTEADEFFFLEVNPRIQVEHGVTELVTGVDIVQMQFEIALSRQLSLRQQDVNLRGSAIECRINAEDPASGFRPSPGVVKRWHPPDGPGVRVDTHCYGGYIVPPHYDSLVAKVMTVADDRSTAAQLMKIALDDFIITGIDTNLGFMRCVVEHDDFAHVRYTTRWVDGRVGQ